MAFITAASPCRSSLALNATKFRKANHQVDSDDDHAAAASNVCLELSLSLTHNIQMCGSSKRKLGQRDLSTELTAGVKPRSIKKVKREPSDEWLTIATRPVDSSQRTESDQPVNESHAQETEGRPDTEPVIRCVKKKLTVSDTNKGQARLMLPTKAVEEHILSMWDDNQRKKIRAGIGVDVVVFDVDTKDQHHLAFTKWLKGEGNYVLKKAWIPLFVKRRKLKAGDEIVLCWDNRNSRFEFRVLHQCSGHTSMVLDQITKFEECVK